MGIEGHVKEASHVVDLDLMLIRGLQGDGLY